MADLSDVESVLRDLVAGWTYPNGTSQPSAITIGGAPIPLKVGRGWPTQNTLRAALDAKQAFVSIYSLPAAERLTSRFPREWEETPAPPTTISGVTSGLSVTLAGTISTPQNIALKVGAEVYVHAVQPSDTLAGIASAFALAAGGSSSGPTITLPHGPSPTIVTGGAGSISRELRRQERQFLVTVWCYSPTQRDAVAAFVDAHFAGMGNEAGLEFIALPDGYAGRLKYVRTMPTDTDQLVGAFRRDLVYSVEYPTTETQVAYQIVDTFVDFGGRPAPIVVTTPTSTVPVLRLVSGGTLRLMGGGAIALQQVAQGHGVALLSGGALRLMSGGRLLRTGT